MFHDLYEQSVRVRGELEETAQDAFGRSVSQDCCQPSSAALFRAQEAEAEAMLQNTQIMLKLQQARSIL